MATPRPLTALACVVMAASVSASLSACSAKSGASAPTYTVDAGDDTCEVEQSELPAGPITFEVTNSGSDVTEVYVYGEKDGDFSQIVDEVENIGPGTSRDLQVDLSAGQYQVTCKPGMVGDGIGSVITVKASGSGGGGY